jgi:hypothetical protein
MTLAVAVLALLFAIGSFWWLNARRGHLEVVRPRTYAFAKLVRLRLPLAFFNTGAAALVVADLQLVIDEEPPLVLQWITTRTVLRPQADDDFAFATPFSVQGRATREVVAEFGADREWSPAPGTRYRVRLQSQVHPSGDWRDVLGFDWWTPPTKDAMDSYVVHRNDVPTESHWNLAAIRRRLSEKCRFAGPAPVQHLVARLARLARSGMAQPCGFRMAGGIALVAEWAVLGSNQ